jgi:hypothetical protein
MGGLNPKAPDFPIVPVLRWLGADVPDVEHGWKSIWCPFHDNTNTKAASVSKFGFICRGACMYEADALKLLLDKGGAKDFADAKRLAEEITGGEGVQVESKPAGTGWGGAFLSA